ncbi:Ig-like domain-containing protein [Pseudomonas sp. xss_2]|uniref:Ig-like domain-containing protein n=1 Tax=Pseudomonas sp. xss_2 TaxID=3367215 RepID=UPI00370B34F1
MTDQRPFDLIDAMYKKKLEAANNPTNAQPTPTPVEEPSVEPSQPGSEPKIEGRMHFGLNFLEPERSHRLLEGEAAIETMKSTYASVLERQPTNRALTVPTQQEPAGFGPAVPTVFVLIGTEDKPVIGLNLAGVLGRHLDPDTKQTVMGLQVALRPFEGRSTQHTYQLFWHEAGIVNPAPVLTVPVRAGQEQENILAVIPAAAAVVGEGLWYLRVITAGDGNTSETVPLDVFYKDTVPGGVDDSPAATHPGLLAPTLTLPPQLVPESQIAVTIAPYVNLTAGDVIILFIGNVKTSHPVLASQVIAGQPLVLKVRSTLLESIQNLDTVTVYWRVVDLVLNSQPKPSQSTLLRPNFSNGRLGVPLLLIGGVRQDTEIQLDELGRQDLQVRIRATSPPFLTSDQIVTSYEITSSDGQSVLSRNLPILPVGDAVGGDHDSAIPNADLLLGAAGQLWVNYVQLRNGVEIGRSPRISRFVRAAVRRLPAPVLPGNKGLLLTADRRELTVELRWPSISLHDWVTVVLSGTSATDQSFETTFDFPVDSRDVDSGSKVLTLQTRNLLPDLNGGRLAVSYRVRQGAAEPVQSEVLNLLVGEQANPLPTPTVVGLSQDRTVPPSSSATITIWYKDMAADDLLSLVLVPRESEIHTIKQFGSTTPVSINVKQDVVASWLDEEINVFYTVRDRTGRVRVSQQQLMIVADPQPLDLVPPESPLAVGGLLDPVVIPEMPGATFTVNYPGMLPLDQVQLLVSGVDSHASAIQTVSRPGPLTFVVPRNIIVSSLLKTVRVYYTLTRNGQLPQHSAQLDVLVNPPLMVDQRELVLNGLSVRYAPWPRVADSLGNSFTREAVGGLGPYQYVSSNTNVASVSSTGKVVGNANGLATITITDKLNNRISYQVRVSNVWRLNYVTTRPWTWDNAVQWMESLGGRPADGWVINDLHRAYGRPLRLERYIWNCVRVNHNSGEFYHHGYAPTHGRAYTIVNNPGMFGGLCITPLNG